MFVYCVDDWCKRSGVVSGNDFYLKKSPVLRSKTLNTHCRPSSKHPLPLLCDLYWLRVLERIEFKLSVVVFRCLHGLPYVASELRHVALSHTIFVSYDDWWPRVLRRCAACLELEHFVIQRDCVWDTRHLQASFENACVCHVIQLIFVNCAHRILFCILTL